METIELGLTSVESLFSIIYRARRYLTFDLCFDNKYSNFELSVSNQSNEPIDFPKIINSTECGIFYNLHFKEQDHVPVKFPPRRLENFELWVLDRIYPEETVRYSTIFRINDTEKPNYLCLGETKFWCEIERLRKGEYYVNLHHPVSMIDINNHWCASRR